MKSIDELGYALPQATNMIYLLVVIKERNQNRCTRE